MTDQYRLLAGISSGRIDTDHYGSFEIEDGECIVEDYDTASSLVRRYSLLGWNGDDPGRPDDDSEDSEALEAEPEIKDESESANESDADAENEDVENDEEREIHTCSGMDGECTRRVDEPGGLCWQHED